MKLLQLALVLLLLAGVVVVGGILGVYLFSHVIFGLTLSDQKAAITLPPEATVKVDVSNVLDIRMNGIINAQVPLKQTIDLPLVGHYNSEVEIDAPVPMKFDVVYEGAIPIDTFATITAHANFNFKEVKTYKDLAFTAKIPLKFKFPVTLKAPIDDVIRLKYRGPLAFDVNQVLKTPLDIIIPASLKVDQVVSTPITTTLNLKMQTPRHPIRLTLQRADLRMRLDSLRLERAKDSSVPKRLESPWGPADPAVLGK